MNPPFDLNKPEDELRVEARRRVNERAGFRRHLLTYLLFVTFFWVIWAVASERSLPPWPVWPTLGWGIAVVLQGVNVYAGRRDVEAEVDREVEMLRRMRRG